MVETHLATFTMCAFDVVTLRQTVDLLGQLPHVAAPRPFTVRESDVRSVPPIPRAWWRLPWAQGLVAAAAVLLVAVVAGGVVLMGRGGMLGAPAAPEQVALQAPAATGAEAEEPAADRIVLEAETEGDIALEKEVAEKAAEAPPPAPAPAEEATAEFRALQEVPAEAARAEGEYAADEVAGLPAGTPTLGAAGLAPTPMPTASPPQPMLEAATVVSPPVLIDVKDLKLEIQPGLIRVSGRLPLPEGRSLSAELWQNGQPIEWTMPASPTLTVGADGQFSLELQAPTGARHFDLYAMTAAEYEIRIHPVDPPEPVEARIPFDTFGEPPPPPTSSP